MIQQQAGVLFRSLSRTGQGENRFIYASLSAEYRRLYIGAESRRMNVDPTLTAQRPSHIAHCACV